MRHRLCLALMALFVLSSPISGWSETRTGSAIIESLSRYQALGTTVYFLKVGSVTFAAERQGEPCKDFFTGDQVSVSYDESTITMIKDSKSCRLSINSSF
jgi:hypothetical protein